MALISLIIPTYNDLFRLQKTLPEVKDWLNRNKEINIKVYIINDGGIQKKDTKKICDKFNFIFMDKKHSGLMDTIIHGLKNINSDYYLILSSDSPVNIKYLNVFIKYLDEYDIVQGSRLLKNKNQKTYTTGRPLIRILITKILSYLNLILYKIKVQDTQIDFKIFNKKIVQDILPNLKLDHDGMKMTEILIRAYGMGLKIKEIPVDYNENLESIQYPSNQIFSFKVMKTIFLALIAYFKLFFLLRKEYKNNKFIKNPFRIKFHI